MWRENNAGIGNAPESGRFASGVFGIILHMRQNGACMGEDLQALEGEMGALEPESKSKRTTRVLVGLAFVWVGIQHFVDPEPFVGIVPT